MLGSEYSKSAVEVLDILDNTKKSDVDKIPLSFIQFLVEIASEDYEVNLDHSKPINKMKLQDKTKEILGVIYINWWCNQKEKEDYMKQIKQIANEKQKEAVDAKIIDNKIIPGKKGYVVNINKSYYKMKQYGKFEESLLVYKDKLPTISYHDYLDKYVIKGNDEEKNVGLLFLIDD